MKLKKFFVVLIAVSSLSVVSPTAFAQTPAQTTVDIQKSVTQSSQLEPLYFRWLYSVKGLYKTDNLQEIGTPFSLNLGQIVKAKVTQRPSNPADYNKPFNTTIVVRHVQYGEVSRRTISSATDLYDVYCWGGPHSVLIENKADFPIEVDIEIIP
ncbi:hypothetical protein NQ117_04005 [Paenibacillus sp. SC116]|uniref:hypothetical protein n=1 Tax=Paenibacillus sp. SC116 TaxID=2968986 RepID=UPI00215AA5EC|nr:hypothetical protein [Paenibacillus sp. SC116]MCR8842834.1 hypothetical protein [Paenibacillus sp. SC116]